METSSPCNWPNFSKESQQPQVAQFSGPGQAETTTQARSTGPLQFLLDKMVSEDQVEDNEPAPLNLDGGSGGWEDKGAQKILQLATPDYIGISSSIEQSTFYRECQTPNLTQPNGPGQAQALTQGSNTVPLQLFFGQMLTELLVQKYAPAPVNLEDTGQHMDTTPELPLTQE